MGAGAERSSDSETCPAVRASVHERAQRLFGLHDLDASCGSRSARRVLLRERRELQLGEQRVRARAVHARPAQRLQVERDRHVAAQRDEPLRQDRVLAVLEQPRPIGGPLHLLRVLERRLQRAVLADEVARALLADAGHPGTLSTESPTSASTSTTRSGGTPNFSSTPARS